MLVVIDGPAGAGKSSTAKAVARKAGIDYIDSGALYRGFTLLYLLAGRDEGKFFDVVKSDVLSFEFHRDESSVRIRGEDVTDKLRSREVSGNVSTVAAFPQIRKEVSFYLKKAAVSRNCIAEGRDLGTVVFPDADLKFFLTADINERAARRHKELSERSDSITLDDVKESIAGRDFIDSTRKADPLKKAEDAIEIDTTKMTFDEQVHIILAEIEKHTTKHKS